MLAIIGMIVFSKVVCTGLNKERLSSAFEELSNVTIFASHGMAYSWGENIKSIMAAYDAEDVRNRALHISKVTTIGSREWISRSYSIEWNIVVDIAGFVLAYFMFYLCDQYDSPDNDTF